MSIWQTKKWGEMLVASGQAEKVIEINGIYIEKRKVAMGEYGLFILGLEKDLSEKDVNELINLCKKEKTLFLQVECFDYEKNSILNPFSNFRERGYKIREGYYKKFITPYTAVIDTSLTLDQILSNMKPKGRYNIKLAEKKGIQVLDVDKTDENIALFYKLMLETTSRDGFNGNTIDYYKTFLNTLENSKLLLAFYEGIVIAGGIFTFDSDISIYYYGASSGDTRYRNLMSPYLLQWTAIKLAKENKSKLYDFLGVATPGDENSPLAGVTDFKKKFTSDIRLVSDSYIFINKKCKYFLINFLRKIKKG
ncbi:MAG: peptidoglycan bridge formation glycyltransferase FemA/FemB family protein [Candidatus Gracilibacteria bacterium]|nr:peptidoglycan bridge formation glycyltransferase FemA/FemB family protein [Candidatus Gracilibacteria bacterium]